MTPATPGPDSLAAPERTSNGTGGERGRDARRFWAAYAVSAAGSGVSYGALPLIAVTVLHATDVQVTMVSALAGIAAAAMILPAGPWLEFSRKRPVMIGADLVRAVVLASIRVAALCGLLTYGQLCAVAVVSAAATMAGTAASNTHLKALIPADRFPGFAARLETTLWVANTLGPPAGGLLAAGLGPAVAIGVDAASFAGSAAGWRRLRSPEPPPPVREPGRSRLAETAAGWRYILAHRQLCGVFASLIVFGSCIMASQPLIAVLLLRDIGASPAGFGIALGAPGVAGIAGALLAPRLIRAAGLLRVLLAVGVVRCCWMGLLPLAPHGTAGIIWVIAAESAVLGCAGIANPAFATWRARITDDRYLARVIAAWTVSNKLAQPVMIAAAGLLTATIGVRPALGVLAAVVLGSAALLPWPHLKASRLRPAAGRNP